jgi:DNA-binding MarR family transcriptional regulator
MEATYEATELERELAELEAASLQLSWLARRRLEQELADFGLTPPQYMALRCMQGSETGCSMSELAESSYQVSATMTGIVDRLVESGLARREPHPTDRRSHRVVLTEHGTTLLEEISRRKRLGLERIFGAISSQERQQVLAIAQRALALLENSMER